MSRDPYDREVEGGGCYTVVFFGIIVAVVLTLDWIFK